MFTHIAYNPIFLVASPILPARALVLNLFLSSLLVVLHAMKF